MKLWLFITLLVFCCSVRADITHVSLNRVLFSLGDSPKLKINFVSIETKPESLQFFVRQHSGEERLMVKPLNQYLLLLTGFDVVNDVDAQLVIKEFQTDRWQAVKTLSIEFAPASKTAKAPQKNQALSAPDAVTQRQIVQESHHEQLCKLEYQTGSTLWRIASHYKKQWQVSTYGAALAIYDANLKAFNNGNIESLREDISLQCPSMKLLQQYGDDLKAKQTFERLTGSGL